jgi:hypothetical protein
MKSRRFKDQTAFYPAGQERIAGYRIGEDQSAGIKHIAQAD